MLTDTLVYQDFYLAELVIGYFGEVAEVEAQQLFVYQRAFLGHVGANNLAQRGLQQVRGRVVALNLGAAGVVDAAGELGAQIFGQIQDGVHDEVVFLLRVQHAHLAQRRLQVARVANLPPRLGVERRLVEHDLVLSFAFAVGAAVAQNAGWGLVLVVADECGLLF